MTKKTELYANTALTIIGLGLGIYFYLENQLNLSLFLFSLALASILYQFLGGIGSDNSLRLGAIKFGGAGAVLLGFMYFIKYFIFIPNAQNYDLSVVPKTGWIPVSLESGKIPTVQISNQQDTLVYPSILGPSVLAQRKGHEYQLSGRPGGPYTLELKSNPVDTVGFINLYNFKTTDLFNRIKPSEQSKRIQVFELYPEAGKPSSTDDLSRVDLPFTIEVFSSSRFSIEPFITKQLIVPRTSWIVPGDDNSFYVVFLEQADFQHETKFTKWLVEEFEYVLER